MTTPPILELRDLHVTFRGRRGVARAVDGVDLEVTRGEVVALVGESGCGKTTLARAVLGLVAPGSGEVRFDGAAAPRDRAGLRALRRRVPRKD